MHKDLVPPTVNMLSLDMWCDKSVKPTLPFDLKFLGSLDWDYASSCEYVLPQLHLKYLLTSLKLWTVLWVTLVECANTGSLLSLQFFFKKWGTWLCNALARFNNITSTKGVELHWNSTKLEIQLNGEIKKPENSTKLLFLQIWTSEKHSKMHEVAILGISGVQQNTTCFVILSGNFKCSFAEK